MLDRRQRERVQIDESGDAVLREGIRRDPATIDQDQRRVRTETAQRHRGTARSKAFILIFGKGRSAILRKRSERNPPAIETRSARLPGG